MKTEITKFEETIAGIWLFLMFSPIWGINYFQFKPLFAIGLTLFNMVFMGLVGLLFASIYYATKEEAEKNAQK